MEKPDEMLNNMFRGMGFGSLENIELKALYGYSEVEDKRFKQDISKNFEYVNKLKMPDENKRLLYARLYQRLIKYDIEREEYERKKTNLENSFNSLILGN